MVNHRCRRRLITPVIAKQRGWHIIESSIAVVALATFMLGVSDVVRIFNARTAVRQGVVDGLRCLYPTAESCTTDVAGGLEMAPPLYRSFVQGPATFQYMRSDYSVSAVWRTEPIREATSVRRSLSSLQVRYKQDAYRDYHVRFPVQARAMYLLKTRDLPSVELAPNTALSANQRVLQARFIDRDTNKPLRDGAAGSQSVSLAKVRGATSRGAELELGKISFSLADAWPSRDKDTERIDDMRRRYGYRGAIPCYQGETHTSSSGSTIQWSPEKAPAACRYQNSNLEIFNGKDLRVPIMIRIRGDRYDTDRGSRGVVRAELEFRDGDKVERRSLGGRAFESDTTNGDFVIRGVGHEVDAAKDYFSVCKEGAGYSECDTYASLPLIPRDARVTITFLLKRSHGTGSVGWAGDSLQVVYPQFRLAEEVKECGTSREPHSCERSVAPMLPIVTVTERNAALTSEPIGNAGEQCIRRSPQGSYASPEDALAALQPGFASGAQALRATSFSARDDAASALCPGEQKSFTECQDEGRITLRGCEQELPYSRQELLGRCGVEDFQEGRDTLLEVAHTDHILAETDRRAACTGVPFPGCASAHLRKVAEQFLASDGATCSDSIVASAPEWMAGRKFDYASGDGCPNLKQELEQQYRLLHPAVPPQAAVVVAVQPAPALVALAAPSVQCQSFSIATGQESECASGVPYYAAQQCCRGAQGACRIEQVSAGGAAGSANSWDARLARATLRAAETVQVAYPRVQSVGSAQCAAQAKNCLQIQGTKIDNDTRVQMRASMQVPLSLMGWLGLSQLGTVEYTEARTLEAVLVGDQTLYGR